jgi:hypothetical protein
VLTPQQSQQQQQQQRKGGGRQSDMGSSSLAADFTLKIPTPINTSHLVNQDDNRSRMLFGSAGDNNRKSSWGNDGVSAPPSSATLPPGLPLDRMPSGSVGPIGTPTNSSSHSEYSQFNNASWLSQPKAEQTVPPASDRFSLGGNDFGLSVQPPPSSSASDNWMGSGGVGGRSMHNMPPAQQGRGESFPRGMMNQDMRPNDYRGGPGGGMGGDMRGNYPMQPQQQQQPSGGGNMMGMDGRGNMDRMQGNPSNSLDRISAGNFGGNTNQNSNNWNNPNVPVNTRSSNNLPTSQGSSFLNQNQWEQQNRFSTGIEDNTNSTYFSSSGRQSPPSFLSQQHQQQQSMAQSHNQRDQQQQHQFMQNQSTYSNIPSTGLFGDSNFNNNAFQQQQQHQQQQTQQQQPKYNSNNNNLSNNSPFHQQGGGGGYSKY